jgi:hypothetical protein
MTSQNGASKREALVAELGLVPNEKPQLTPQQFFYAMAAKPVLEAQMKLQDYLHKVGAPEDIVMGFAEPLGALEVAIRESLVTIDNDGAKAWAESTPDFDDLWELMVRESAREIHEDAIAAREVKRVKALETMDRMVEALGGPESELGAELAKVQEKARRRIEQERAQEEAARNMGEPGQVNLAEFLKGLEQGGGFQVVGAR